MYLPTLSDALLIAEQNTCFIHQAMATKGAIIHDFSYSLPGSKDFAHPVESRPYIDAMELRGLTFVEYPDGKTDRYLMLRKFFSYGAHVSTRNNALHETPINRISVKRDGSIARFIRVNGQVRARTQKRILALPGDTWADGSPLSTAPHTEAVQAIYDSNPALQKFVDHTLDMGVAAIFEYEDVGSTIVVKAHTTQLVLTQLRCEATGAILPMPTSIPGVSITDDKTSDFPTIEALEQAQRDVQGIEGWVVQFGDQLVKFKTQWYDSIHDLSFEGRVTPRTMLTALLQGHLDDALAHMGESHHKHAEVADFLDRTGPAVARYMDKMIRFARDNADAARDPGQRKALAMSLPPTQRSWLGLAVQFGHLPKEDLRQQVQDIAMRSSRSESTAKDFIRQAMTS